jgi:hypothetical protein
VPILGFLLLGDPHLLLTLPMLRRCLHPQRRHLPKTGGAMPFYL